MRWLFFFILAGVMYRFGGVVGLLICLLIGGFFLLRKNTTWTRIPLGAAKREMFFGTLFKTLGFLAKSDGKVSEIEISFVEQLIAQFHFNAHERNVAIDNFNQGKGNNFAWLESYLLEFNQNFNRQTDKNTFMNLVIQLVILDHDLDPAEKQNLYSIATVLGWSKQQVDATISHLQGYFRQSNRQRDQHGGTEDRYQKGARTRSGKMSIAQACEILGVSKESSLSEIKTKYRKLVKDYHPDKLIAQKLPDGIIEIANEKTKQLNEAVDTLNKYKKQ